ncbi:hypothetical protein [Streptomyces rameus]|uniref:hypothetical protein n=1 Tax=Streptomyces rameus TaxID=68261 RepID=UPI0031E75310
MAAYGKRASTVYSSGRAAAADGPQWRSRWTRWAVSLLPSPSAARPCADGGEQGLVEWEGWRVEVARGVERAGAPVEVPGQQRDGLPGHDPNAHGQCLVSRLVVGSGGEVGEDGRGLGGGRLELTEQGRRRVLGGEGGDGRDESSGALRERQQAWSAAGSASARTGALAW